MTDLEKSLSVLNDLLHYFREAVSGVPKNEFEGEREFEEEIRLKEFWNHLESFTYNELEKIESVVERCNAISSDIEFSDMMKVRKYAELKLDMEANGNPKNVEKELWVGVPEI